jgi:hypothetical protein
MSTHGCFRSTKQTSAPRESGASCKSGEMFLYPSRAVEGLSPTTPQQPTGDGTVLQLGPMEVTMSKTNPADAAGAIAFNCATSESGLDLRPSPGWMTVEVDEDFVASNGPSQAELEVAISQGPEGQSQEELQHWMTITWKRARVLSLGASFPGLPPIPWGVGDYVYFHEGGGTPFGSEHVLMLQGTPVAWSPGPDRALKASGQLTFDATLGGAR